MINSHQNGIDPYFCRYGYYRNRCSGDTNAYFNSELRFALEQRKSHFLPFYYGVFGFYNQGRVYWASPGG